MESCTRSGWLKPTWPTSIDGVFFKLRHRVYTCRMRLISIYLHVMRETIAFVRTTVTLFFLQPSMEFSWPEPHTVNVFGRRGKHSAAKQHPYLDELSAFLQARLGNVLDLAFALFHCRLG